MPAQSDSVLLFDKVARLPEPGDNVAIACQPLPSGTRIQLADGIVALPHTVLEGHRFAVRRIAPGQPLLTWGLPFGVAVREIARGDYICNEKILSSLAARHVKF